MIYLLTGLPLADDFGHQPICVQPPLQIIYISSRLLGQAMCIGYQYYNENINVHLKYIRAGAGGDDGVRHETEGVKAETQKLFRDWELGIWYSRTN